MLYVVSFKLWTETYCCPIFMETGVYAGRDDSEIIYAVQITANTCVGQDQLLLANVVGGCNVGIRCLGGCRPQIAERGRIYCWWAIWCGIFVSVRMASPTIQPQSICLNHHGCL